MEFFEKPLVSSVKGHVSDIDYKTNADTFLDYKVIDFPVKVPLFGGDTTLQDKVILRKSYEEIAVLIFTQVIQYFIYTSFSLLIDQTQK